MKRINQAVTCLLIVMLVSVVGVARGGQKNEQDEPATLIKAAKYLEEKPFGKDAKNVRAWALNWVITTDKVSVTICSLLLSGPDKKYKYNPEILGQYTIGMAAFKLSNPDKAKDEDAAQLSGIESALLAYVAMVKEQPKARTPFLDDLAVKSVNGSLANYVAQNNCKDKK